MAEGDGAGRNVYERVGALEQEMHTVIHRLDRFDADHGGSPNRLTKLEQQFDYQNRQLEAIGESQEEMGVKLDKLGNKIAYGLGAAAVILYLLDKVGPYVFRGLFP